MPRPIRTTLAVRPLSRTSWISAIRAMMPPSPWLSARMMKARYLIATMIVIAQNTSEMTP